MNNLKIKTTKYLGFCFTFSFFFFCHFQLSSFEWYKRGFFHITLNEQLLWKREESEEEKGAGGDEKKEKIKIDSF